MTITSQRVAAVTWAREMLAQGCLVLDTETTGLDGRAELVQIAVVDSSGRVALDTLVQPIHPIPARVTAIHGLTDSDVRSAPLLPELWPSLWSLLDGRPVLAFNAPFDERMLRQGAERHGLPLVKARWGCLMRAYCDFCERRRSASLASACQQFGIAGGGAHHAIDDARAALALLYILAASA